MELDDILPLREARARYVRAAVVACEGNVREAARRLRVSPQTVYDALARLGVCAADLRAPARGRLCILQPFRLDGPRRDSGENPGVPYADLRPARG